MGSKQEVLVTELRAALKEARAAKLAVDEAKGHLSLARQIYADKISLVREIEDEIEAGKTGRDLIDKVGTVHTSEQVVSPTVDETKAKLAEDALSDLIDASANGNLIDGKHRRRKAASIV